MNSAVTGLQAQQTAMDIISNNIANVNTAGFKSSRATFKDLFYQTLSQGTDTQNPWQVGYGSVVGSVDKVMSRVGANQTDRSLDLYLDGEGFFVVNTQADGSGNTEFTRVGNFDVNKYGYLVDSNGNYVMSASNNGGTVSLGKPINLESQDSFITLETASGDIVPIDKKQYGSLSNITFNNDGSITANLGDKVGTLNINTVQKYDGTNFPGDYSNLSNITFDGTNYKADYGGSNRTLTLGTKETLKIGLANFVNQDGLSQNGNNTFIATNSSGAPNYFQAGLNNSESIRSGALEMSNVDLAKQFTDMIVTERGYQSNARTITKSDEMMQELVNLVK